MSEVVQDKRPLSPHLQIYKIQITSLLSILHRGTGIVLYGGAVLWVLWLLAFLKGPESYQTFQSFLFQPAGLGLLFIFSLSFFYHFCNGIRHLLWDAGYGYEIEAVRRSGWAVVISTFILTLISWIIAICWGMIWS